MTQLAQPDAKRDQNSVLLLRRAFFREESIVDHTQKVMAGFDKSVPVASGDLLLAGAEDIVGRKYLLASFHGDTNGLATLPVLAAVHAFAKTMPEHHLIFGLDAVKQVATPKAVELFMAFGLILYAGTGVVSFFKGLNS